MARRISLAQLQSKMREIERKQRQAVNDYNRRARQHNQNVKQAVSRYNREVAAHNARVRGNRQRLKSALRTLQSGRTTTTYAVSVRTLASAYARLDEHAERNLDSGYAGVLDLAEREAANGVVLANALDAPDGDERGLASGPEDESLLDELASLAPDLSKRWSGALYSLDPRNPDAARHFCASSREIVTQILEIKAPDSDVLRSQPDCQRTRDGKPTRREKIQHILRVGRVADPVLAEFVDEDVDNVLELFSLFNAGTHGAAGKFEHSQLCAMRTRVADAVLFLTKLRRA